MSKKRHPCARPLFRRLTWWESVSCAVILVVGITGLALRRAVGL